MKNSKRNLKYRRYGCLEYDDVISKIDTLYHVSPKYKSHILFPFSRKCRSIERFISRLHSSRISLYRIVCIEPCEYDTDLICVYYVSRRGNSYYNYFFK